MFVEGWVERESRFGVWQVPISKVCGYMTMTLVVTLLASLKEFLHLYRLLELNKRQPIGSTRTPIQLM